VRFIDYDLVSSSLASALGVSTGASLGNLGTMTITEIALVRCVDSNGKKLTAFCETDNLRALIDSGEASDPQGMRLTARTFLDLRHGWLKAG